MGGSLLLEPVGPEALHVELHEPGRIGVAAVDQELDRCGFTAAEPVGEIGGQHDDAFQLAGDQLVLDLAAVASQAHVEVSRVAERGQQAVRLRRRLFHDHANGHAAQVERDAKGEDEQEQERQHAGDHEAAWIAEDLDAPPCG